MKVYINQEHAKHTKSATYIGAFRKLMESHFYAYKKDGRWLPGFASADEIDDPHHHIVVFDVHHEYGMTKVTVFRSEGHWYATKPCDERDDFMLADSKLVKRYVVYSTVTKQCFGPYPSIENACLVNNLSKHGDTYRTVFGLHIYTIHEITVPE